MPEIASRKRDAEAEIAHLSAGCDKRSFALKRKRVVLAAKLFDQVVEPLHENAELGNTDAIIDAELKESSSSKKAASAAAAGATKTAALCHRLHPQSRYSRSPFASTREGALSSANLRSADRHIGGKKGFLEPLEFATGLQGTYELRGRMRLL